MNRLTITQHHGLFRELFRAAGSDPIDVPGIDIEIRIFEADPEQMGQITPATTVGEVVEMFYTFYGRNQS